MGPIAKAVIVWLIFKIIIDAGTLMYLFWAFKK